MKPTPARELAQSDPKELEAIQAAVRDGRPLFFIQSGGSTLDVVTNEGAAISMWRSMADRSGLGYRGVQCFKRIGDQMFPMSQPGQVH